MEIIARKTPKRVELLQIVSKKKERKIEKKERKPRFAFALMLRLRYSHDAKNFGNL